MERAVVLTAVELAADSAIKYGASGAASGGVAAASTAIGVSGYALIGWLISLADKSGFQWGILNAYWNALNNIVTPLAFTLFFNERYSTTQWIGIVAISIGIALVASG